MKNNISITCYGNKISEFEMETNFVQKYENTVALREFKTVRGILWGLMYTTCQK